MGSRSDLAAILMDNDDLDEEFIFLLQLMLAEQNAGTHFQDEISIYRVHILWS